MSQSSSGGEYRRLISDLADRVLYLGATAGSPSDVDRVLLCRAFAQGWRPSKLEATRKLASAIGEREVARAWLAGPSS